MGVSYVPVARLGELSPGEVKPIELGGRDVLLIEAAGKYFVCDRLCPHEGADLTTGVVEQVKVRCANNGYCFYLAPPRGRARTTKKSPPATTALFVCPPRRARPPAPRAPRRLRCCRSRFAAKR